MQIRTVPTVGAHTRVADTLLSYLLNCLEGLTILN